MALSSSAKLVIAFAAASVLANNAEPLARVEGYAEYRFGMSLAEADAVSSEDRLLRGRADTFAAEYLAREQVIFGEVAEVAARFDKRSLRLAAVNVRFNAAPRADGSQRCLRLLRHIEAEMTHVYGTEHLTIATEPGGRNWRFPVGGEVSVTNLCVGADSGAVSVSFRP